MMTEDEFTTNLLKLKNYVPLPEHLRPEPVKTRKPREDKPYMPRVGSMTYYVLEILKSREDEYMSYIVITNILRSEYHINAQYKNIATLLYNLAKESRVHKHSYIAGTYKAVPADSGPADEDDSSPAQSNN